MEQKITYKGMKKLDDFDVEKIRSLTERYFLKVERNFSNAALTVDVKKAAVSGKRSRYTVKIRVSAPTKVIVNGDYTDWELKRAVHKAFANVLNSAKHKYKK